uniref:Uncharacterized protein n=1 Tax=Panagrolaimus sp. ES5 TaxID=591445 RepID=A0AC34FEP7_9BILA
MIFTFLAYFSLSYILYRIFRGFYLIIYPYLIATPLDLHKLAGGAKWAIVTGSTDGIGKEYALQLAQRGFNLILISRTQTKLDSVKAEIAKEYNNIQIETVAYNFTNANLNDYKKDILPMIEKKEIGILVNNVGFYYDYPDIYHKVDLQRTADIVIINTVPVSILTAAVLPQMVKRNAGIIVNISSGLGYAKVPYLTAYSASKAYINHLGSILRAEYANSGITIQTLCPLMVSTNMSKRDESFFILNVKKMVESSVKTIGIADEIAGTIAHQIQSSMFGIPQFILDFGAKFQVKAFEKAAEAEREKALKQQ